MKENTPINITKIPKNLDNAINNNTPIVIAINPQNISNIYDSGYTNDNIRNITQNIIMVTIANMKDVDDVEKLLLNIYSGIATADKDVITLNCLEKPSHALIIYIPLSNDVTLK